MSRAERPNFSKRTLQAASYAQRLLMLSERGAPIVSLFTGSKSPVYHQLEWVKTGIHPSRVATVKAPGDPEAGWLAKNWGNAVVMSVGREALRLAAACRDDGQEAVGFVAQDTVFAARLPPNVQFGFGPNANTATAAMRQGRSTVNMMMGWLLPEGELVVPADLVLLDSFVPVTALPHRHQGTPLF